VVDGRYEAEWAPGPVLTADAVEPLMREALVTRRRKELDRGLTLVGPHRDDWRLTLNGLESRTHASQGEQRTLALGLRLASHRVASETIGDTPVLLLDDVFSELDEERRVRLVQHVPSGQTIVTTAGALPAGITPECAFRVHAGGLEAA
jgi:DNA replication and repair protein RecF